MKYGILIIPFFLIVVSCQARIVQNKKPENGANEITTGATQVEAYLPLIRNLKVGLLVNHTSKIDDRHLIDTLLALDIEVKKIFAPEHGFRGDKEAGANIKSDVDAKTGLPVISLYGQSKKPSPEHMAGLDAVIFDIQDVGARFYTYISAMHYMMEACAENNKRLFILDRPNPNGMYIDGPVLDPALQSYVGMHPIPILHGMSVGELAQMINGEGWLAGKRRCDLTVIPVKNYNHSMHYSLPVNPSPNLPNDLSIRLYPSLCLFEGTQISVARGTMFPFQAIGYPNPGFGTFEFMPKSIEGMALNPPHSGKTCYGIDFREQQVSGGFTLRYLIDFYNKSDFKDTFFNNFFDKLAGSAILKERIRQGWTEESIRKEWLTDLEDFKMRRSEYLLYED